MVYIMCVRDRPLRRLAWCVVMLGELIHPILHGVYHVRKGRATEEACMVRRDTWRADPSDPALCTSCDAWTADPVLFL